MYEDSTRVDSTNEATRQIPVSELLARHRGEQAPGRQWESSMANETTDVISVIRDDVIRDDYEDHGDNATDVLPVVDHGYQSADVEADTVRIPVDGRPSGEIYIRELLRREGRLPREQRRRQAPRVAAAAAGVAALCGAVTASIVHIQNADDSKSLAGGPGVPLTVVDDGGPRGHALDAPLTPRGGGDQVTTDSGTATKDTQTTVRVAPYVKAMRKAAGGLQPAAPTTTNTAPPSTVTSTPPPTVTSPPTSQAPSDPPRSISAPPPSSSTPGLLGGLLGPVTGLVN